MVIVNYPILIQNIDKLISAYKLEEAKGQLKSIEVFKVPVKHRVELAALSRRVGLNHLSLKFLQDVVYGAQRPEDKDVIEFSSVLRKVGLVNQALRLLTQLKAHPASHLQKAFCYINTWDYEDAKVELEEFLSYPNLTEDQRVLGKVNLLTCYIESGDFEQAFILLDKLEKITKGAKKQLYLNCLEERGQILIRQGKLDEAISVLNQASVLSGDQVGSTSIFINKWLLLAKIMKNPKLIGSEEVVKFRQWVRNIHHWEALRDFDGQIAKISQDIDKLKYVYFGTPFIFYRDNLGFKSKCPEYIWGGNTGEGDILDLYNIHSDDIPFGMGEHRILMLLASDLYRPWTVERIFNGLYGDELFDPNSSPKKVYRLVEKLINKVIDNAYFSIGSTSQGYRLRKKEGKMIRLYENMQFQSQEEFVFNFMKTQKSFQGEFTVALLMDTAELSQHQSYRLLAKMKKKGLIPNMKQKKIG